MAVYFITGKLGAGKTLAGVSKIKEYLESGKKVATNLDIYPEHLVQHKNKTSITRLPDKPRAQDLYDIGTGDGNHWEDNKSYDESKFGALVLDECATWLNTRNFRDKERPAFIEYLLHSRKYRWDIYFFVQDEKAIDKQILDALCEHLVVVKRLDRVGIPFFGFWVKTLSLGLINLSLPKIHLALVYYGVAKGSLVVERWFNYGSALYNAYRTGQVFREDQIFHDDDFIDMRASYCVLSAWHLKGRYQQTLIQKIAQFFGLSPRAVARKPNRKNCKQSYLVRTISDASAPLHLKDNEMFLFPEPKSPGLAWNLVEQAD